MAGDVVAGDVEEQQVVEAGEEVGREEGERVVLEEQLLQVGALLEDGRGQGGQVVVGEVQELQLRHPLESLGLQLHVHAAGPLAVVSPDDQLPQVLQAHEGRGREEFDLAELDGELPQLRLGAELVSLHHRLVEVNIGADHGQSVGILHLAIKQREC